MAKAWVRRSASGRITCASMRVGIEPGGGISVSAERSIPRLVCPTSRRSAPPARPDRKAPPRSLPHVPATPSVAAEPYATPASAPTGIARGGHGRRPCWTIAHTAGWLEPHQHQPHRVMPRKAWAIRRVAAGRSGRRRHRRPAIPISGTACAGPSSPTSAAEQGSLSTAWLREPW